MSLSITVVIMAYNEAASLAAVLKEINSTLVELGRKYEVIIVNDGSSDETGLVAELLAEKYSHVRVIHHASNLGLGGVYRTGFSEARNELVTYFPADGQFPASIIEMFTPLMEDHDMVLGFLPDRKSSLLSKGLSKAEKVLFRLLFGKLPTFQGIMMFKRTMLNEISLHSSGRGWAVVLEFIIRATRENYRIISVPTEMRPRLSGRSKVNNIPTIVSNLKQAFALRRYL